MKRVPHKSYRRRGRFGKSDKSSLLYKFRSRPLRAEALENRLLLASDSNPFHNDILPTDINDDDANSKLGDLVLKLLRKRVYRTARRAFPEDP